MLPLFNHVGLIAEFSAGLQTKVHRKEAVRIGAASLLRVGPQISRSSVL
jgi:hypothetical protein